MTWWPLWRTGHPAAMWTTPPSVWLGDSSGELFATWVSCFLRPSSNLSIKLKKETVYCRDYWTGMACWLERRTRDRKVASSNRCRSGGKMFFSRVNFLCWLLFGVRSTPVLPQQHIKDPGHSAKSAGDRLHLNTHTPLTRRSRNGLIMPLSRHCVGTCPETSSHATCQRTFGHSRLSSLSHCGLILA